jgi:hypothetical protein
LAFTPRSQSRVRSSPWRTRITATKAWNDALVGAIPIFPFQDCFVSSQIDLGSCARVRSLVLYARTRARPLVPTQRLPGARKRTGTFTSVEAGSTFRIPSRATRPRRPDSCEKKTSAGLREPSSSRVAASCALDP